MMKHLKMIDEAPTPTSNNKIIWSSSWIRAKYAGLFQPVIQSGEFVNKNQVIGAITDPFGAFKETVKSPASGYVVGLNNNPVANAGDALVHLGYDDVCKIDGSGDE